MLPSARKARSRWSWRRPRTRGSRCVRSGSQDQSVDVLVEIPRGSRTKYELDQTTGRIRLDRVLFSSVHYPADYGFVIDTIGGDGDPLDALIVVEEPTFPGCVVPSRPIGTLLMRDEHGDDEKILAVPVGDIADGDGEYFLVIAVLVSHEQRADRPRRDDAAGER